MIYIAFPFDIKDNGETKTSVGEMTGYPKLWNTGV